MAVIPTGSALDQVEAAHLLILVDIEDYRTELLMSLVKAKSIALENIRQAQAKQKSSMINPQYRVGERVMEYMPGDVAGKMLEIGETIPRTIQDSESDAYHC